MYQWNSIQLNKQYVHVCGECDTTRKAMDGIVHIQPGEKTKDYGHDVYVHYTMEGKTLCGSDYMVED